ncbi:MAG: FeoA family protein [Candidatus Longimicrobiales bacterium M2_2A_002]
MTIVERLRDTLRGVAGWKETCDAGAPVPKDGSCSECGSVPLTNLGRGARGSVSCLEEPWTADAAKLASLGILPGVRLRIVQRSPAWVLRMGRTEIALDDELASQIRVLEAEST